MTPTTLWGIERNRPLFFFCFFFFSFLFFIFCCFRFFVVFVFRLDLGWRSGQPGSGVAIDWVTGRSYSSAIKAKRRINVQSGLRKARYMVRPA